MPRASERKYGSPYGKGERAMPIVNLQHAVLYTARRAPFAATQCFGRWVQQYLPLPEPSIHDELIDTITDRRNYIVYSGVEGNALPLFIYDEHAAVWFENSDPLWGKITTRQRKRLRPVPDIQRFDNDVMLAIARFGFNYVAKQRLNRNPQRSWRDELRSLLASHGRTVTGRWSNTKPSPQELADAWRKIHVLNQHSPSMQEMYTELVKLQKQGGVK